MTTPTPVRPYNTLARRQVRKSGLFITIVN